MRNLLPKDAVVQLQKEGFVNVSSLPIPDLKTGWLVKDGSVESVTVNGSQEYKKNEKFRLDASIVVTYHTFKKSR